MKSWSARGCLMGLMGCLTVSMGGAHPGNHEPVRKGDSSLPSPQVQITVEGGYRWIRSNGIPNHATGAFPNSGNPNAIRSQSYQFRVPLIPTPLASSIPVSRGSFGVAINGVPFDPGTDEFWRNDRQSGWRYEALGGGRSLGLDEHHAHVQPNGAYHYHSIPSGLVKNLNTKAMALIGYGADGYPIYCLRGHQVAEDASSPLKILKSSYRLKSGTRPSGPGGGYDGTFVEDYEFVEGLGDLDVCNGRRGVTPEYPDGVYYYVLTESYPYIPRYFRGIPDPSFLHQGPPPGARGGPGGRPPGGPGGPPPHSHGPPPRPF